MFDDIEPMTREQLHDAINQAAWPLSMLVLVMIIFTALIWAGSSDDT